MSPARGDIDVAALPTVGMGSRSITWWGTLGFMVIEGTTLAICAMSYLYLRRNFATWPPSGLPQPALTVATVDIVLYLASLAPMIMVQRAACRLDLARVRLGLVAGCVAIAAFLLFRALEFAALRVQWDSSAYGSIAWAILGFHATLLVVEAAEVVGMTAIVFRKTATTKTFADAEDVAFYWYFLVGSWVPLYVLVFLLPRIA